MKMYITNNLEKELVVILFLLLIASPCFGQKTLKDPDRVEVNIKIVSAEVHHFDKPIRIGPVKRAIEYQEALVLRILVDPGEFDSLPPSVDPFLYIGNNEYHIFHIDRSKGDGELILTFHIRNWEKIRDGEKIVLTTDHGDPVRNPKKYSERNLPLFNKNIIIDNR